MMVEAVRKQYETEVQEFQNIDKELAKAVNLRQNYAAKLNENTMVKSELDLLRPNAEVYKLVGPILVASDLEESKLNVAKRIDYISNEIKRIDGDIDSCEKRRDEKRIIIEKLQEALRT